MRNIHVNDPKHWRDRADRMRATAAKTTDHKTKATLLGMADGYDKVARDAETRIKPEKSNRSAEIGTAPVRMPT